MSKTPARLAKPTTGRGWEQRITPYVPYILLCLILLLLFLVFTVVFVALGVSAHSVTGTEANNFYYGLQDVI